MNLGFLFKSIAPLGLGSGLGVGGVALYKNITPETWQELLSREGVYLIHEDGDYKAIFYDQEEIKKTIDTVKDENDVEKAFKAIKEWCQQELAKKPKDDTQKFEDTRKKILSMCSHRGITSIKGRIAQAGNANWISDTSSDTDKKYKTIFAVYKYHAPFLNWINEGKEENSKVKQEDKPSEKYTELKSKCETSIKAPHPAAADDSLYSYTYWWCQALPYGTVEERIKKLDSTWQQRTTWDGIDDMWKDTTQVTSVISDSSTDSSSKYQTWCTTWLKKDLSEDDVYQDKYLVAKAVCRQPESA